MPCPVDDSKEPLTSFFSLTTSTDSPDFAESSTAIVQVHGCAPLTLYKVVHGVDGRAPDSRLEFSHTEPNSVYLIPSLLNSHECQALVRYSDRAHEERQSESDGADLQHGPFRWHAHGWPSALTDRVADIAASRLLPTLGLGGQQLKLLVRCITRYQVGSGAPPHTDPGAFTAVVLLDDLSRQAFVGGGTEFWAEEACDAEMLSEQPDAETLPPPTLRVAPRRQGCAVIFGEGVVHAAGAVTEGVRHVLVLVFSLHKKRQTGRIET